MDRAAWAWARLVGAACVLGVLVWRVGTGPFIHGIRAISGRSLLAALAITAVTTVCCAWRWQVVAQRLGVTLALPAALTGYYRSQFLNSVLPGGVLGDVHRGVRHGQDTHDVLRGLRAVAWERTAGQLVQVVLAMLVLLVAPSPVRSWMPSALAAAVGLVLLVALGIRAVPHDGESRIARAVRAIRLDVSAALSDKRSWPAVTAASAIVVIGHTSVFIIAARTAAPSEPLIRLLPLAMLVLLAMTVPLSIGGWGPREGVAAWAFGAAGLGLDNGVAAAAAYGVMSFVATLPGVLVLLIGWLHRRRSLAAADRIPSVRRPRPRAIDPQSVHG
jgi:uncharacterized membrane protein YbhN (UPF0104 family)